MPKEDFTEREIRKIKEVLIWLLQRREEKKRVEIRQKLDELISDNEFPLYTRLVRADISGRQKILLDNELKPVICELFFQLMSLDAELTADENTRMDMYQKAIWLGEYAEALDRTYSQPRRDTLEELRNKLERWE